MTSPLTTSRKKDIARLCKQFDVSSLSVFGSALDSTFEPATSDIDFLVDFPSMAPRPHANAYFGLLAGLKDLFPQPVGLIERKAIRNHYYRDSIEATASLIYEHA